MSGIKIRAKLPLKCLETDWFVINKVAIRKITLPPCHLQDTV